MSTDSAYKGPVKQPAPEHKVIHAQEDVFGTSPQVGDVVHYLYQPGPEVWPCIVVAVKENDHLDLACFRPDGNNVRYWNIPKHSRLRIADCWIAKN